jgi:hypothetical protein
MEKGAKDIIGSGFAFVLRFGRDFFQGHEKKTAIAQRAGWGRKL